MRKPILVALFAAAALALGGTALASSSRTAAGIAGMSPTQILAAAKTAGDAAQSVHVKADAAQFKFEFFLLAGHGGYGKFAQGPIAFDLIRAGKFAYFRGDSTFWGKFGDPAAAKKLAGHWIKVDATSGQFASLTSLTDLRALVDSALKPNGAVTKGGTSTVDGYPVVELKSKDGSLFVATSGQPYPIEIAKAGGGGQIVFDQWNKPVSVKAPAGSLDFNKLTGK
jgi:hypothetical protein